MRIDGTWVADEDGLRRPLLRAKIKTHSGEWLDCPFLVDTAADRTVIAANVYQRLGLIGTLAPRQLGGVGGTVETLEIWAEVRFSQVDGMPATITAKYAAFNDPNALEESVLGRDVLGMFAVILDLPANMICFLHGNHRYLIQES